MRKSESIRGEYQQYGVRGFYERFGDHYRNPHEAAIREALHFAVEKWALDLRKVLDLACGSGEVTSMLRDLGCPETNGIDPYTGAAYLARVGQMAEDYSFEQIASGALSARSYSLIVCSFALHLVEESRLPLLAYQLSRIAPSLLILSPHKRPHLNPAWGWTCTHQIVIERVRMWLYRIPT